MSRLLIAILCACASALATPVSAQQAVRTKNLLVVVPINQDTFEVLEARGAGARDMWCAAADYARAAGLDGLRRRLFIETPRGPSKTTAGQTGVVFTTNPGDDISDTPSSYSVTVNNRGENLSIGHAHEFCYDAFRERFDRF